MPMMRCREVAERAGAVLDREADLPTRLRVRLHLAACAPCRRFLAQMRAARALLRGAAPPPLDPAREEALVARVLGGEPRGDEGA
ncbi:hypothetical protein M446_3934 [Methylobacterium sp. 4-46]|uniref:zf-HC2 domain-containing protein n=1 Tax=unclassified Methylobacterium TaxID=2615210 RepID=UPI000165C60B|nr:MULTISPECIES: zf-HC2 domain-containing protein [Methylobacterium]ACA18300.1 hypothetical protein M446_3934 [Methylobacterium sp. 4-46]WFT77599.1 zf-HC2 domain-containing protein [Methylobacterium nodulans]